MSFISEKIFHQKTLVQNQKNLILNSVIRNIQNILNTRSSLGIKGFINSHHLDNLSFGLPDLSCLNLDSFNDKMILMQVIQKALMAFEPRLSDIKLELGSYIAIDRKINIKLNALLNQNDLFVNLIFNLRTMEFLIDERERQ